MAVNKAISQYLENSVITASPEELTLMLYNGLIRYITQAQKAVTVKDIQGAHNNIIWAEDILLEFKGTLDFKYDISRNLSALYDYMYRRLVIANTNKDREILAEVLKFAVELRDTWAQAMKINKEKANVKQAVAK